MPLYEQFFLYLFPIVFVGFWLLISTILSRISGWPSLSQRFPDRDERAERTLHFVSGAMGVGVNYGNCLTLAACPGGLRVGVLRILGPFDRPFFVPWSQVAVERRSGLFGARVRLTFGAPAVGRLDVSERAADQLAAATTRWPERDRRSGAVVG